MERLTQTYPCWIVLEHAPSNTAIAYCAEGFGPGCPWGLLFLEGEHLSMGMDSGWFTYLSMRFASRWPAIFHRLQATKSPNPPLQRTGLAPRR
jgi:hypothetical protein